MLAKTLLTAFAAVVVVACAASPDDASAEDPGAVTDEALSPKSVNLMYEGTCAFLHNCSSWSRRLPAGHVQWGCGGTDCDDDELWMAGPSHSYCNRKAKVCKGSKASPPPSVTSATRRAGKRRTA